MSSGANASGSKKYGAAELERAVSTNQVFSGSSSSYVVVTVELIKLTNLL